MFQRSDLREPQWVATGARWRSEARGRPGLERFLVRVGAKIREQRTAQKLTLEELAEKAALTPNHVQAIESGRSNVTAASLYALAAALGVSVAELVE